LGALIFWFSISIAFSFLCSILEAALLSITPSYVTQEANKGTTTGKLLEEYKKDIDKPLSAILTLNTVAHTAGAIGVGAAATKLWGASMLSTVVTPVAMTLINNLLNFEKMSVRDIMTPRTVAFMVDEEMTVDEFVKSNPGKIYSRIPVYKGDKDNITGTVLKDDILACVVEKGSTEKIKDLMLEANYISDKTPLPDLFQNLTQKKQHLSVVRDEYGSVVGLVTMEDMFETLLGQEIVDESDEVVDLQKYAKEKYGDGKA